MEIILQQNNHQDFDTFTGPGKETPYSGVYRCEGCGHEIAANQGTRCPTKPPSAFFGARRYSLAAYRCHSRKLSLAHSLPMFPLFHFNPAFQMASGYVFYLRL